MKPLRDFTLRIMQNALSKFVEVVKKKKGWLFNCLFAILLFCDKPPFYSLT